LLVVALATTLSKLETFMRPTEDFYTRLRVALATLSVASVTALVACGGGGSSATGTSTAAAPASYALGAITGFGSVIVGGVRYDDSMASVSDEDGNTLPASALALGSMVQVDAGEVDHAAGTAVAHAFRLSNEIVGPVGTINSSNSTVDVLGQTVLVTSSTVFDSTITGGLAGLMTGDVVEVHGIAGSTPGQFTATRIEPKTGATAYRLRGAVAALDTTAKSFSIGGALISYAGLNAADVPASLADGLTVRVVLQTTQLGSAWVATRLKTGKRESTAASDSHVEGAITVFASSSDFEINGLKVDASSATFPGGASGVVLGAHVEVSGSIVNGVLVATRVEVDVEQEHGHGQRALELHGTMSNLDSMAMTFALRGVTVWYGGTVTYPNGTVADLASGKKVDVYGVLSTDRTRLEATRIVFKP
jgi:hypothetical protein